MKFNIGDKVYIDIDNNGIRFNNLIFTIIDIDSNNYLLEPLVKNNFTGWVPGGILRHINLLPGYLENNE